MFYSINKIDDSEFIDEVDDIIQLIESTLDKIIKLKPNSSKGTYLKSISMSSTMSPGINIDTNIS